MQTNQYKNFYNANGFLSGVKIIDADTAKKHRSEMEGAEAEHGSVHYKTKIHTLMTSPYELATLPQVLDLVEQLIGPDILLFNTTYIIKEPDSTSHVSWHQDLTYWGLSHDDQVTMWLALSPASEQSGCMRMVPASHLKGRLDHHATHDADNVLLQGQTVQGVNEENSVMCPLAPGEASFHHGWTLHASMPNRSTDRRIGLNVQYIAPHVRQTKHDLDTAVLVRGTDQYNHFKTDNIASENFAADAVARHTKLQKLYEETAGTG